MSDLEEKLLRSVDTMDRLRKENEAMRKFIERHRIGIARLAANTEIEVARILGPNVKEGA